MKRTCRIVILEDHCKSCELCVEVCPKDSIRLSVRLNKLGVNPAEMLEGQTCSGCRNCIVMCPDAAIQLIEIEDDT